MSQPHHVRKIFQQHHVHVQAAHTPMPPHTTVCSRKCILTHLRAHATACSHNCVLAQLYARSHSCVLAQMRPHTTACSHNCILTQLRARTIACSHNCLLAQLYARAHTHMHDNTVMCCILGKIPLLRCSLITENRTSLHTCVLHHFKGNWFSLNDIYWKLLYRD